MFSCSFLPASLLVVLFAFPALAAPSSPNDLFRDIAVQVPRSPEPQVCCLRVLEPLESTPEEDPLISFEEWKAKRVGEGKDHVPGPHPPVSNGHRPIGDGPSRPGLMDTTAATNDSEGLSSGCKQDSLDATQPEYELSPHFRIPIVDRFNYASTDCSARVHTAHRSAKSASAILSSAKDRYMLSPCEAENQFVVVELCDDIMIDTVQLANFEFFSGVFKDFTVSVAKTFPVDESGWTHAGTYRAQNVRGVQSFHPPPTLRDFYRLIRISFHSHYGNEYYCPLSLFRVYGLTHLEQWKWDEWDEKSRATRAAEDASVSVEVQPETQQVAHVSLVDPPQSPEVIAKEPTSLTTQLVGAPESTASTVSPQGAQMDNSDYLTASISTGPLESSERSSPFNVQDDAKTTTTEHKQLSQTDLVIDSDDQYLTPAASPEPSTTTRTSSVLSPHISASLHELHSASEPEAGIISESVSKPSSPTQSLRVTTPLLSPSLSIPSLSVSVSPHPHQVATGGESIYRTIMNRLTALEANTTLYARYVEEQTAGVRDILRRLGEDVGRLEGIGKAQAQMYQRSVMEFDKQRRRLEIEHSELLLKVNHLTDEVVLEKRLGIAQLCLILAVLVFMTLTRGSRGEHLHINRPMTMRDWGRRTLSLSLSGDWVNRFRSRSPPPKPAPNPTPRPSDFKPGAAFKVEHSPLEMHRSDASSRNKSLHPGASGRRLVSRPRTPSSLRTSTPRHHNHSRAMQHGASQSTPLSARSRPPIQRSASGGAGFGFEFGGAGPSDKSAKRWARSAHLHEVKSAAAILSVEDATRDEGRSDDADSQRTPLGDSAEPEPTNVDIFSPKPASVSPETASKGKGRRRDFRPTLSPLRLASTREMPRSCVQRPSSEAQRPSSEAQRPSSEADGSEGGGWVDTDGDGSESELGDEMQVGGGNAKT